MTIESLVRERELKQDGIGEFLARTETLEYDLEEDISPQGKQLILNEIARLRQNVHRLRTEIKAIEFKMKRLAGR